MKERYYLCYSLGFTTGVLALFFDRPWLYVAGVAVVFLFIAIKFYVDLMILSRE